MRKPRIALAFAFAFLIVFRIIAESFEELTIIVAMINLIALFVVLFDVGEKTKDSILKKIQQAIESKKIAHREIRQFPACFYLILISV